MTIRDHEQAPPPVPGMEEEEGFVRRRGRGSVEQMTPGVPMKILETSLPFVYGAALAPDGEMVGPTIVDIRKSALVRLNPEVAKAIQRFVKAKARKAKKSKEKGAVEELTEENMNCLELAMGKDEADSGAQAQTGGSSPESLTPGLNGEQVKDLLALLEYFRGILDQKEPEGD